MHVSNRSHKASGNITSIASQKNKSAETRTSIAYISSDQTAKNSSIQTELIAKKKSETDVRMHWDVKMEVH